MGARTTDPQTSHDAAATFSKKVGSVNDRIVELARAAGKRGSTQSDIVAAMPEFKPGSITPRFARLLKKGRLVRVRVGTGKPTKHFPTGRPLYMTRLDETTGHNVLVHWVPEFAPALNEDGSNNIPTLVERTELTQCGKSVTKM